MATNDTIAGLQAALDALNAARATGVRQISYMANGISRLVEYKSDIEMNAAAQDLSRRILALTGVGRRVRISSSKGLDHHCNGRNGEQDYEH